MTDTTVTMTVGAQAPDLATLVLEVRLTGPDAARRARAAHVGLAQSMQQWLPSEGGGVAAEPRDELVSLAERVHEEVATAQTVNTVAEALRLRDEGMSLRGIAEVLAVGSHTTVRKWIKAAEEIQVAG